MGIRSTELHVTRNITGHRNVDNNGKSERFQELFKVLVLTR